MWMARGNGTNRSRKNILFIDASDEEHYKKGKNQNNLREEDIQRIDHLLCNL